MLTNLSSLRENNHKENARSCRKSTTSSIMLLFLYFIPLPPTFSCLQSASKPHKFLPLCQSTDEKVMLSSSVTIVTVSGFNASHEVFISCALQTIANQMLSVLLSLILVCTMLQTTYSTCSLIELKKCNKH